MSDQETRKLRSARALRLATFVEALQEPSLGDDEIKAMLIDNGEDPDKLVARYRSIALAKIREASTGTIENVHRKASPARSFSLSGSLPATGAMLDIERVRERIDQVLTHPDFDKSRFAAAYRSGAALSDNDIRVLYEDLVELGIVREVPPA
jgi:hypothetical protein